MSDLSVKNLSVMYRDGLLAVSDVSFCLSSGSTAILIGTFGDGKSSIMRAIAGLFDYEGEITLEGRDLRDVQVKDRNFVYCSFDSPLFMSKTVSYNLSYGLAIRKTKRHIIDERLSQISKDFNIAHLMDRRVKRLSGFERRLIIILRAFMRNASLYLFNQPLRGLNADEGEQIAQIIASCRAKTNATTLISTFDYQSATSISSKIRLCGKDKGGEAVKFIAIRGGKKICEGDEDFFRLTPPDAFWALFASESMKIISARLFLDERNNITLIINESQQISVKDCVFSSSAPILDKEVLVGIREQSMDDLLVFDKESKKLLYSFKGEAVLL